MMENKDILLKVLNKADEIKIEKRRKKRKFYSITTLATSLMIIITLSFVMPSVIDTMNMNLLSTNAYTGTFFADTPYLGYIIIGLIAFILGVVVTLICYKLKDNERD
ncbi:MAG: hypothetical protein R3Y58_09545 [Eubacteriales bacterium]